MSDPTIEETSANVIPEEASANSPTTQDAPDVDEAANIPSEAAEMVELSDEQKAFLEECETAFANRYTTEDKEFMQFVNAPKVAPPCVHPWRVRPRRDFQGDFRGGDRRDDRGRDHYRRDHRRDGGNHHHDRGYDRNHHHRDRSDSRRDRRY